MAMDNMSIRKAQLEKLDEFVHNLYKETQTFKNYGVDLKDLEMMYLHIHDLITDLLECDTTDEFMAKIAELHKAIAGVLIIAIPANAQQVADELKGAHEAMSDMNVEDFLKNMQVKEKPSNKSQPSPDEEKAPEEESIPKSQEERESDKIDLLKTLELEDEVEASTPKESQRDWGKEKPSPVVSQSTEEVTTTTDDTTQASTPKDPLDDLWLQWGNK